LVSEGIEQEIIKNVNLEYMSNLLMGILNANSYYFINNPNLVAEDEFLEASFNFLWDSIKK
jgi:hypothetical protein